MTAVFDPNDPASQATFFVGHAMRHVVGRSPYNLMHARRAVGEAIRLFVATGLTREQAVEQVISLAETLGALE